MSEREDAVTALVAVEAAVAEIRRAILVGTDVMVAKARERLERATGDLVGRLSSADADPEHQVVTKPVTEEVAPAGRALTARPHRLSPIDPDTIRLVRRESGEPGWRVLAGPEEQPEILGFLNPAYSRSSGQRNSRWEALSTSLTKLGGGPWKTRNEAVARLVAGRRIQEVGSDDR